MMAKFIVCVSTLLLLLLALSKGSPMRSCCTRYHEPEIPVRLLRSYTIQDFTQYCNIEAVIFKTVRNRLVCVNPYSEWVQRAIETVQQNF